MAVDKFSDRLGHKYTKGYGLPIYPVSFGLLLPHVKGVNKMAQIKWVWLFCDMLGIPFTLMGIASNVDDIKSTVIAILAIIYLMGTGYYRFRKWGQEERARELDLWHKEMDKQDRINKTK